MLFKKHYAKVYALNCVILILLNLFLLQYFPFKKLGVKAGYELTLNIGL
jgi:hypothetical protein